MTVPVVPPLIFASEAEGLKASAVALALTLFPVLPQMREKNVGRLVRVTFTVTMGFTPKGGPMLRQSDDDVVELE